MASSLRDRLRAEDGFSLIELLAALSILLVGIVGVAATLDKTRDAVTTAEVRETTVYRAERELERIRTIPFAQLGLTSLPQHEPDPSDPAYYVTGTSYQWDPRTPANTSLLVTGGSIAPRATWNDGRMSGTLQVFVTRYDDPAVTGTSRARRVSVGVTVNGRWRLSRPTVVSTVIHEPPPVTP